ncbi:copine-8-like [Lingula anatina]|uniref:Copine-3 n=1 Tax=Lingula anatina TaxID=7574 RepID=A0A1S3ID35_LINAN|nr:copine-8-like [Lingula anatina]|eukprot:XP_013395349.1 copine-8-like [Lingula anatina]
MASLTAGKKSGTPSTVVEIAVSARNIIDADVFSKSDPFCVLRIKELGAAEWREAPCGRTEVVQNCLNPDFAKKFTIDYYFEQKQHLRFELYDQDSKSADLSKQDFLGSCETALSTLVTSGVCEKPIHGPKKNSGTIIFVTEQMSSCKEEVELHFQAENLDKKDFLGKSDPFLKIYKENQEEEGKYTLVHTTEYIKKTLNPDWAPFVLQVRALCNGDYDRKLRIECWDHDFDGGHDLIGEFTTTLRALSRGRGPQNEYEVINHKKKDKRGSKYKNSGVVKCLDAKIQTMDTFLDYIQGGTQIHVAFAIDFTSSNGDPSDPSSLHYNSTESPNLYASAIRAVGDVIQDYDSDKLFPAVGFGANVPPDFNISHQFSLNGKGEECEGIDGVIQAYYDALSRVQLHGPTCFAPSIDSIARQAQKRKDGKDYFILLILTDGVINDMPDTKQAIVETR